MKQSFGTTVSLEGWCVCRILQPKVVHYFTGCYHNCALEASKNYQFVTQLAEKRQWFKNHRLAITICNGLSYDMI